jgi:hypothetical protein
METKSMNLENLKKVLLYIAEIVILSFVYHFAAELGLLTAHLNNKQTGILEYARYYIIVKAMIPYCIIIGNQLYTRFISGSDICEDNPFTWIL